MKSELIKRFCTGNMTVIDALKVLLVLADHFEDKSIVNWASKELTGYNMDDELPNYRVVFGQLFGQYQLGYVMHSHTLIPDPIDLDPETMKKLKSVSILQGISSLIEAKNVVDLNIRKPLNPSMYEALEHGYNINIVQAYILVGKDQISDLIGSIELKILKTLLYFEKEFGCLDSLELTEINTSKEVIKNVYNFIYLDKSISIGDNNEIKDSEFRSE